MEILMVWWFKRSNLGWNSTKRNSRLCKIIPQNKNSCCLNLKHFQWEFIKLIVIKQLRLINQWQAIIFYFHQVELPCLGLTKIETSAWIHILLLIIDHYIRQPSWQLQILNLRKKTKLLFDLLLVILNFYNFFHYAFNVKNW